MFIHVHKWSEYFEAPLNKHPFQLPKLERRECLKCHKTQERPFSTLEVRLIEEIHKLGQDSVRHSLEVLEHAYGMARYTAEVKQLLGLKDIDNENVIDYTEGTMKPWQKTNQKRNREMFKLHQKGMSLREIGKRYKISGQRVGMILSKLKLVDKF